ncbi:hypothetical protein [Dactylosporangium sp. CA-139066]|uniref:hypothetical protein n=1 Tax=Dactylosporangium sp. CA-139066 TaxID=3239930 RepID=UPI003D8B1DBD
MTRGIYLRPEAIDRLTAAVGVKKLNRRQQSELLHVPYQSFWNATSGGRRVGVRTITELMAGIELFAKRYRCKPLSLDEVLEIREIDDADEEIEAAIAA